MGWEEAGLPRLTGAAYVFRLQFPSSPGWLPLSGRSVVWEGMEEGE